MSDRRKRYSMMILLIIALLLCYVDRVLISLAGIEMQREFGWSDTEKGQIFSVFFVGYLCMQLLGGFLSNRFGGRNVFMLAVLGWSVVTIVTPPAAYAGFGILLVARFALGFGEGAAYPSAYNLVTAWMPPQENARSISWLGASAAIGTVFALLVVGKMIEWQGWQFVFYLFGAMGVAWCVVWVLLVPDVRPREPVDDGRKARRKVPLKEMIVSPSAWPVYTTAIAYGVVSSSLASWLPSYFVDTFDLSITGAGLYSVLPWILFAVSAVVAGAASDRRIAAGSDRLGVRRMLITIGFLTSVVGALLLMIVPNPALASACISLVFAGLGITTPGYVPLPAELFPRHGDIFYGIMAAMASLATIVVVAQTGVIVENTRSYNLLWAGLAGLCALSMMLFRRFADVTPILVEDCAEQPGR